MESNGNILKNDAFETYNLNNISNRAYGMYESNFEHDNCGIGAIVNIKGVKTHDTVVNALKIVENLEHRAGKEMLMVKLGMELESYCRFLITFSRKQWDPSAFFYLLRGIS